MGGGGEACWQVEVVVGEDEGEGAGGWSHCMYC